MNNRMKQNRRVFLKNAAKEQPTKLHPLGTLTVLSEGIDLAELYDMQNSGAVGFYDFKRSISNSNLLKYIHYAAYFFRMLSSLVFSTTQIKIYSCCVLCCNSRTHLIIFARVLLLQISASTYR